MSYDNFPALRGELVCSREIRGALAAATLWRAFSEPGVRKARDGLHGAELLNYSTMGV